MIAQSTRCRAGSWGSWLPRSNALVSKDNCAHLSVGVWPASWYFLGTYQPGVHILGCTCGVTAHGRAALVRRRSLVGSPQAAWGLRRTDCSVTSLGDVFEGLPQPQEARPDVVRACLRRRARGRVAVGLSTSGRGRHPRLCRDLTSVLPRKRTHHVIL